jgi:hypothetical protein
MTSRPLDFESSAYASSATSARPAGMVQPAKPLGCGLALEAPCYPRAAAK